MIILIKDIIWLLNVYRAMRYRKSLIFSKRIKFDGDIRPKLGKGQVIGYPDAFYHLKSCDVARGITKSKDAKNANAS